MSSNGGLWLRQRSHELVLAGALLTRLPMPRLPAELLARPGDGAWAYPLVGLLVGGAAGVAYWTSALLGLPGSLGALAALAVSCAMTGCLHEDGLADFADGIGGGRTKASKLEIMRDSRIGTYGTVSLILSFTARYAAISVLSPVQGCLALVVTHMMSRGLLGVIFRTLEPARGDGLSAAAGKPRMAGVAFAILLPVAAAALFLSPLVALAITVAAGTAVLGLAWLAHRHIGGHTGDVFGAGEQVAEIATLWTLASLAVG